MNYFILKKLIIYLTDIQFQTSTRQLVLAFRGVSDPHSPVVSQWLSVGRCPGCQDVLLKSNIGIASSKGKLCLNIDWVLAVYY